MKSVFVMLCVIVAVAVARSPIPQEYCPQLDCPNLNCPSPSYQGMDASGCHTCTCCPGYICNMYCENGFRIGDNGCPKCECRDRYET